MSACQFTSRERNYRCEIVYKIYYPGETVMCKRTFMGHETARYYLDSSRGTNYLWVEFVNQPERIPRLSDIDECILSTTAPVRVISFNKEKINDGN